MPSWKYPKEQERPKFAQLVIPTLDSVRYEKLLTLAYSVQKVGNGDIAQFMGGQQGNTLLQVGFCACA